MLTLPATVGKKQKTETDPTNPLTDVSVNGIATMPLEGIVTFVAEMVKLGAGVWAEQKPAPSNSRPAANDRALLVLITETSSRSIEGKIRESRALLTPVFNLWIRWSNCPTGYAGKRFTFSQNIRQPLAVTI